MKKAEKIETFSDPTLLAWEFLNSYCWAVDLDDPAPEEAFYTLRRWREEYYIWQEGRYIRISDDTVKQRVTQFLQEYVSDIFYREKLHIPVKAGLLNNVILNLQTKVHIRETQELNTFLDRKDRGRFLCMDNGLLNLQTLELIPHTPNYFSLVQLPYQYDPNAPCPGFELFLQDIMLGRQGYVDLLQEFVGYLFRPDLREQKFLLCVGEGANGKGVLFDIVQSLVGVENCSQVPLMRFGERFALYSTIGKVVNLTHESSRILEDEAENMLKSYVAGDRLTVDRKNRDPVEIKPTAKLMIATNSLPRFGDKTQAIWRRIELVPFGLVIEEKLQIKNKAELLKKELPGILNWALQGLKRLNEKGFTIPDGQKELMEEYRRDADPARAFLLDHYEDSLNGTYVSCAEVYSEYKSYCETNGYKPMSESPFGKHVNRIFPHIIRRKIGPRRNREYVYDGLVSHVSY